MLYRSEYTHGGDNFTSEITLDFSVNTNPFGTPESVMNAIREAVRHADRYPDPFCREAVRAISDREAVPNDHILLGNGAAELIYSFCFAVKPGSMLEIAPTFTEYAAAVKTSGGRTERYLTRYENSFTIGPDILDAIGRSDAEAVFICNPNNPTGRLIDPVLLREILSCCFSRNIRLVLDECFIEFTGYTSGMNSLLDTYPNLTILKAFTKNYSLAGVRIGYCLSGDKCLLQRMSETVQPWNISVIAQAAAIAAAKEEDFTAKTADLIKHEREWLKAHLEALGFWVCPSDANFLLFQGPPDLDSELRKNKIAIRNCSDFSGLGPGWYRTAVRQHDDNEALIKAIEAVVGKEG